MFEGKTNKEVHEMALQLIQKENDRGAALLAAVLAEHCLDGLLEKRLLPPYGNEGFISGFNSPIGTFSSKIELAYRIGIIPAQLAKLLNGLRKIRNSYAHEVIADFESQSIANKTEAVLKTVPEHYQSFIDSWNGQIAQALEPFGLAVEIDAATLKLRGRFDNYFAQVIMHLHAASGYNKRIDKVVSDRS